MPENRQLLGRYLQLLLALGVLSLQAVILALVLLQRQPHAARHLRTLTNVNLKPAWGCLALLWGVLQAP